jgi:hypothetical protein
MQLSSFRGQWLPILLVIINGGGFEAVWSAGTRLLCSPGQERGTPRELLILYGDKDGFQ